MPSAQMSELLDHVRELVPYLRRQIEGPLLKKFEILGSCLLLQNVEIKPSFPD